MIVTIADAESHWEAFQASFLLKRAHKRLNRTVIQALIRERLELAVARQGAWWQMSEGLTQGCESVQQWMTEQLSLHGLELERLDLLAIPRTPHRNPRPDLVPLYQENWLDKIPTADGFELSLTVVVRNWVPPAMAGQSCLNVADGELRQSAIQFFGRMDAETALAEVTSWQQSLRPVLDQLEEAYRTAAGLLHATRTGVFREDRGIHSDSCWVTRRQIQPGPKAFVPGQRYGYLDPYQLFFMLRDRKQMHERYRSGLSGKG